MIKVLERLTRFGLAWAAVVAIIVIIFTGFAVAFHREQGNTKQVAAQANYLCSTTGVLDSLVQAVVVQTKANLNSHLYDRLIKNGTLPPSAKTDAERTLRQYEAADVLLRHNEVCR